ncbi:hypothetical protein SH780_000219 [Shigella flexneri]|nr:hypothetical protein [Shigella flexneri]
MFPSSEYLTHLAYGIRRGSVFRTRLKDINFLANFLFDRLWDGDSVYKKITVTQLYSLIAASEIVPTDIRRFKRQHNGEVTISFLDRSPITVEIDDRIDANSEMSGWKILFDCGNRYAVLGSSDERDFPFDKPYYYLSEDDFPDKESNIFLNGDTVYFIFRTWNDVAAMIAQGVIDYRKLEVDI